jgi:two-component system, chemotaxis family, response regulator Rcp1
VNPLRRAAQILLVEDNPGDVRLIREALKESPIPAQLWVAEDGTEALRLLEGSSGAPALRPDLILLDLNLPRMDGRELLARLKGCQEFRSIPVVVLSSSGTEEDVQAAYDLRANAYVVKPAMIDGFLSTLRGIEEFWTDRAQLPASLTR